MHSLTVPPLIQDSPTGVLVVGHGSRDPAGVAEFLKVAELVAQRLSALPVEPCFLELASPTIDAGVERLIRRGVRHIVVLPALLFAAAHANQDVPEAVEKAISEHGKRLRNSGSGQADVLVTWEQAGHIGCHPAVLRASALCDFEVTSAANRQIDWRRLLVGRGSSDLSATREMLDFARLRRENWGIHAEVCFLAAAEPALPVALAQIARERPAHVLVQPHLLFCGALTAEINRQVDRVAQCSPETEWRVCEHLGPDDLVIDALCDRLAETSLGNPGRHGSTEVVTGTAGLDLGQADLARSRAAGYDLD
jgi:sirohydrochlorin cobaltochelatase